MARLLELDDKAVGDLVEAIQSTSPTLLLSEFAQAVSEAVGTAVPQNEDIFDVLGSLYLTRASLGISVPSFVDQLCLALMATEAAELRPSGDDWDTFRSHLTSLLELDQSLGVVAKAHHLLMQHERTIHDIRVFTDIRPIFEADLNIPPPAALITHQLKLSYHQDGDVREFYIALDAADLDRLLLLLNRAKEKADNLNKLLEQTHIRSLEAPRNDSSSSS